MTFTEAAIEVLRREGKPLHFKKLAEIAVREDLLDHVGKIPEETMAGQLAAHCRLARAERRVIAVQPGTFALVEWGLEEDPAGLEGLVELPPEDEPAYRGRERHPMPSRDLARSTGRAEARPRRREEEERRGRRFPPPSEVAYEILAGAGKPLGLVEIAATGAERLLMPDAFVRDAAALRAALTEDNRRREGAGRKALFQLDGDAVTLVAQPEPGERAAPAPAPRAGAGAALGAGAGELRRAALAALRRRLRECDEPTVEHVAMRLLEKLGFRDLKVAKRGREHVVCTGKRRMGLGDVRHAIRILRGGADAGRRDVSDLRRDIGHYGAQIGVVLTPGEAAREARGDAVAAGQLPVLLICGEALAEALADAGVGCVPVVVPEVDEAFFRSAAEVAERDEAARRARREERDRREGREGREGRERREEQPGAEDEAGRVIAIVSADGTEPAPIVEGAPEVDAVAQVEHVPAESVSAVGVDADDGGDEADEGDEGDEEGGEGDGPEGAEVSVGASAGAPGETPAQGGERRRRRRRRRRRGGRGRGPREGAPGDPNAGPEGVAAPAAPPEGAAAAVAPDSAPERPPQPQPPPLPPREPPAGEGA